MAGERECWKREARVQLREDAARGVEVVGEGVQPTKKSYYIFTRGMKEQGREVYKGEVEGREKGRKKRGVSTT